MSLKASFSPTIPEATQQLVEPLLPTNSLYRFIGQKIHVILREADFAKAYAETRRPRISPLVLALVTVFQFVGKLPDCQAAQRAVMRLDWKYALHQLLEWQGFHYTD
ncbi:MAG: hypothetical protein HZC41_26955 [Chloroflexi bacterium]|nr:hypothetical protein [Chloroflexota bacterium]